jgi:regulator of sigma E protease
MDYISHALGYVVPFLVVLTILVFVHEFGHYWVARRCGVKIDSFSIGFGKELFGWFDRNGTRWKISILPLGGYVKMFGDENETSWTENADTSHMSEAERRQVFSNKPLWARTAVVAAGPAFNFLFTIFILSILFASAGERFPKPDVAEVVPGSAAEAAGIHPGDIFVSIDGKPIERFDEVQEIVSRHPGTPLSVVLSHDGVERSVTVTPSVIDEAVTGRHIGRLGVKHTGENADIIRQPPVKADRRNQIHRSDGRNHLDRQDFRRFRA